MTISKLISALDALKAAHGDCVVAIEDNDTDWHLGMQSVKFDEVNERVLLKGADYWSKENILPTRG